MQQQKWPVFNFEIDSKSVHMMGGALVCLVLVLMKIFIYLKYCVLKFQLMSNFLFYVDFVLVFA